MNPIAIVLVMGGALFVASLIWTIGYRSGGERGYAEGHAVRTGDSFMKGYKAGYEIGYLNGHVDAFKEVVSGITEGEVDNPK